MGYVAQTGYFPTAYVEGTLSVYSDETAKSENVYMGLDKPSTSGSGVHQIDTYNTGLCHKEPVTPQIYVIKNL